MRGVEPVSEIDQSKLDDGALFALLPLIVFLFGAVFDLVIWLLKTVFHIG